MEHESKNQKESLGGGASGSESQIYKRRRFIVLLISIVLLSLTIFLIYELIKNNNKDSSPKDSSISRDSSLYTSEPEVTFEITSEISETPTNTDADETTPEETTERLYDYSFPVPQSETVELSYFDDAVFIGDSRTEGFIMNTGLSNAISYTYKGLMADTVYTSPVINIEGEKLPVMEALEKTSFSKVYIMLGINETGWPNNNIFISKYEKIINDIKAFNPDAIIYVQSVLPVSTSVSERHQYVKNQKIDEYNVLLLEMAHRNKVCFVNSAESVSSPDGSLPDDAAPDGIHLNRAYCEKWMEYLKTHVIPEVVKE